MRLPLLAPLALGLVSAIVLPRQANYDGYKVVRVEVGDKIAEVEKLIQKFALSTWNGGAKAHSEVDVVVPADKIAEFDSEAAGLDSSVMHENLGSSIASEAEYQKYASK